MSAIPALRPSSPVDSAPADKDDDTSKEKRVARCTLNGHKAALRLSSGRLCAAAAASEAAHSLAASKFTEVQEKPLAVMTPLASKGVERATRLLAACEALVEKDFAKTPGDVADYVAREAMLARCSSSIAERLDLERHEGHYSKKPSSVDFIRELSSATRKALYDEHGSWAYTCLLRDDADKKARLFAVTQAVSSKSRETVLYVTTSCDKSLSCAFRRDSVHEPFMALAKDRRFVFERVSSPEEITELVNRQPPGTIAKLVVGVHGFPNAISLGGTKYSASEVTKGWDMSRFAKRAEVILDSCETGKVPEMGLSFAADLHSRVGKTITVTAPRTVINAWSTKQAGDTVTFAYEGENVTVRHEAVKKDKR